MFDKLTKPTETCGNCKYFKPDMCYQLKLGACMASGIESSQEDVRGVYEMVAHCDWCELWHIKGRVVLD